MSSDLLPLIALGTMAGFGKGFTPSYTPSYCAPKDDELDKLIDALKDSYTSCNCKQEDSSKS